MSISSNQSEIREFFLFWEDKCFQYRQMNLPQNEIRYQLADFKLKNRMFLCKHSETRFEREELEPKCEMLEKDVEVSLLQSLNNYQKTERIRLKELYGPLSELIYLIGKIKGKY